MFAKKSKISIIYKAKKKAKICEVADTHGWVALVCLNRLKFFKSGNSQGAYVAYNNQARRKNNGKRKKIKN